MTLDAHFAAYFPHSASICGKQGASSDMTLNGRKAPLLKMAGDL